MAHEDAGPAIRKLQGKGFTELALNNLLVLDLASGLAGPSWGWSDQFTVTKGQARKLLARVRRLAADIDSATTPKLKWLLKAYPPEVDLVFVSLLLRAAAQQLEGHIRATDDRDTDPTRMFRVMLTRAVKSATGAFHDAEVSAIISAVFNCPEYDADDQRKFRAAHVQKQERNAPNLTQFIPVPPLPK